MSATYRARWSGLSTISFFIFLLILHTSRALLVKIIPRRYVRNDRNLIHGPSIFTLISISARSIVTAPLAVATRGGEGGGNKGCPSCTGKGAVNCATCRGTGIDRVNGNVFERWTCTKCKGFGYLPCPVCSASLKGLTPEQRGER